MTTYWLVIGCAVCFGLLAATFIFAIFFGDTINDRNHRRAAVGLSKSAPVPEARETARLLERAA